MSTGIWMAASGATSQLTALDTTANNLANASTPGFKADRAIFREHLITAVQGGRNVEQMRFNAIDGVTHDMSAGMITTTGRPLDAAISGEGFFVVRTPEGERYTRAGALQVGLDGNLQTNQGHLVLNEARRPIQIGAGAKSVRLTNDGNVEVDGAVSARLRLVTFPQVAGLEKEGHYLFRATEASGQARVAPVRLETGALEQGNVSVVRGMTEIVTTTRTFDAIERMIDAFRDMERRAAMDIAGTK